ncbi:MAG: PKD domain-containing protein [Bacteroidales bacterium]|nr:PKD domain-containing protein [Bacteroidales bacterium]
MNRYTIILILSLFLLNLNVKSQICDAKFDYQILDDISSFTYEFKNLSEHDSGFTANYIWDFGDGSTSKQYSPEHQYLSEGVYIVSLKMTTTNNCHDLFVDTIHVEKIIPPACMAYFTFVQVPSAPLYTYAFTDHSFAGSNDSILTWLWTFGDGTNSTAQHPMHQYNNTGNFLVVLNITSKTGCQSSYSYTITINPGGIACQASFTAIADSLTNPLKVYFHDNSIHATNIVSWQWYFDDGDSSNLQDPTHIFPYAGIYFVQLKITTQSGCTSTVSYPINVANPQPYNLWGRVYAGPYTIDKCIAYLYKEYPNNYFKPIDTVRLTSVNDTLGVYYFFQVPEGKHKVKVLLPDSSAYSKDYAPTYYGDNVLWNNGVTLNLFQDISLANVFLNPTFNIPGNCQISGYVSSNNAAFSTVDNVELLLYNQNAEVANYTFTDSNGYFEFNDLSTGQYVILGEITGLQSDIIGINLANSFDTVSNISFTINKHKITGFKTISSKPVSFTAFPNPANQFVHFRFAEAQNSKLEYQIYSIEGQLINEGNLWISGEETNLAVNHLLNGVYIVKIFNPNTSSQSVSRIIINR